MSGKSESIRHDTFFMYLCNQKMDEFHIGSKLDDTISISEDYFFNKFSFLNKFVAGHILHFQRKKMASYHKFIGK